MNIEREVGRFLERRRIELGESQEEMAERIRAVGVPWSQGILSKVENGLRAMRFTEAIGVAAVLDVDLSDIAPRGSVVATHYHRSVFRLAELEHQAAQASRELAAQRARCAAWRLLQELAEGWERTYVVHGTAGELLGLLADDSDDEFFDTGRLADLGLSKDRMYASMGASAADQPRESSVVLEPDEAGEMFAQQYPHVEFVRRTAGEFRVDGITPLNELYGTYDGDDDA